MAVPIKDEVLSDVEPEITEEEKSFLNAPLKVEYSIDSLKHEEDEDSVGFDVVVSSSEPDSLFGKDLEDQENRDGEREYDADSSESPSCLGDSCAQEIFKSGRRGVKAQDTVLLTPRSVLTDRQEHAVGFNTKSNPNSDLNSDPDPNSKTESFTLGMLKTDAKVNIVPRSSTRIVRPTSMHSLRSFVVYGHRLKIRTNMDGHPHRPSMKLFQCGLCKKRFIQKSSLAIHELTHADEKPFVCEECKSRFSKKGNLDRHLLVHSGMKLFACDQCKKSFSQKVHLAKHQQTHVGKPFSCDQCTRSFSTKGYLDKHVCVHSGEKPFECDECSSKFSTKGNLDRHLLVHSGEKPFTCDQCKKTFSQKVHLANHQLRHTTGKLFSCVQCSQRFLTKSNLDRHLLVHSGVKPFTCDQCKKKFSQKAHLSKHQLTHVEKPFS